VWSLQRRRSFSSSSWYCCSGRSVGLQHQRRKLPIAVQGTRVSINRKLQVAEGKESAILCSWWSFKWCRAMIRYEWLWPPYVIGQGIIFLPCGCFYLSIFFLAYSQPSQIGCLPYFHTLCGLRANLRCRSKTHWTRLAENTGRKNSPKIAIWAPLHNFVGLYLRN